MLSKSEVMQFLSSDINMFLYDNFKSTEQITKAITGSGVITPRLFEIKLQTGILQDSSARINYNMNYFNPHFSTAIMRFYIEHPEDMFMYMGFKKTLNIPTADMDETHAGLLLNEGKLYLSTGNEEGVAVGHQNNLISGIDLTKEFIYKLEKNRLSTYPLPQRIPYFGGFQIKKLDRIWTLKTTNSTFPPEDTLHYFVVYIKNLTNSNKSLYFKNFIYGEDYPD